MGRDNNDSARTLHFVNRGAESLFSNSVKIGAWLVENDLCRISIDSARKGQPLPLATGQDRAAGGTNLRRISFRQALDDVVHASKGGRCNEAI